MTKAKTKQQYWRSLNELENTPEFQEMIHREFPQAASEFPEGVSRRRWLQLMGASLALGAAGCRFETEKIAPFAQRPQNRVPGIPQKYATTIDIAGQARPLLMTSYDGRPIKVDGSPEHPLSRGATDSFAQALILELYDPDRSRGVRYREGDREEERSFTDFMEFFSSKLDEFRGNQGAGLCVLTEPSPSPTVHRLKSELQEALPQMKWFEYSSVNQDNAVEGAKLAFGKAVRPCYQLENAKIIVSLDADPLHDHPETLRMSRGWAEGRDVDHGKCNRLYCIESQFSVSGMSADHRLPLRSDQIPGFVADLASELSARLPEKGGEVTATEPRERFLQAVAQDLASHKGEAALIVGRNQPPEVHAQVLALNQMLMSDDQATEKRPLYFIDEPFAAEKPQLEQLKEFVAEAEAGNCETLVILGGNPYFDAPFDTGLQSALVPPKINNRVQLSLYENETSLVCNWHVNAAHAFESWADGVIYDGSYGIGQPQIEPLFDGKSPIEFLAMMLGESEPNAMEHVRKTAGQSVMSPNDKKAWQRAVHDGFVADSAATPVSVQREGEITLESDGLWKSQSVEENMADGQLEVVLKPSSAVWDGRFANNGWLQECPDPVTKVTWGNAALIGPATAKALGLKQDQVAKLTVGDATIELPVFIQPGQAPGSIGVALGYGRTKVGQVGGDEQFSIDLVGVDVRPIRNSESPYHASGASLEGTNRSFELACTQDHFAIDTLGLKEINKRMGELVREGSFESYQKFLEEHGAHGDHEGHGDQNGEHADDHDAATHTDEHSPGEPHVQGDVDALADGDLKIEGEGDHGHGHAHHWPERHHHFENFDLNPGPQYTEDNRWGMAIDLNTCTGCHACVVACQSENNVPVVGIEQVRMGREMHWLRIDRYFGGEDIENPHVVTQPVACQHCEKAPCETVCPVAATVHSDEGLNDMVYNRCIGTRYCANNCPYKVRRFNYLNYSDAVTFVKYPWADKLSEANKQLRGLVMNPEVTVRSRGVMEKCSYCVQRIQNTKIQARAEQRDVRTNEVTTACQDACPTNAITFGDINDKKSDVYAAHHNKRSYAMLSELNILPRTKYLARVQNPHPALGEVMWQSTVDEPIEAEA